MAFRRPFAHRLTTVGPSRSEKRYDGIATEAERLRFVLSQESQLCFALRPSRGV